MIRKHLLLTVIALIALIFSAFSIACFTPISVTTKTQTPESTPIATTTPTPTPTPTPSPTPTPEPTLTMVPALTQEQIMEMIHIKVTIDEINMAQLAVFVYEVEDSIKIVWTLSRNAEHSVLFYNALNGEHMFTIEWKEGTEFAPYRIPYYKILDTAPLLKNATIIKCFSMDDLIEEYAEMGILYKHDDFIDKLNTLEWDRMRNYSFTFDEMVEIYINVTPLDNIPGIYEYNPDYSKPDFISSPTIASTIEPS